MEEPEVESKAFCCYNLTSALSTICLSPIRLSQAFILKAPLGFYKNIVNLNWIAILGCQTCYILGAQVWVGMCVCANA